MAFNNEELGKFYKYVYTCKKCGVKYGSDMKEKYRLCNVCELGLRGHKDEKAKFRNTLNSRGMKGGQIKKEDGL